MREELLTLPGITQVDLSGVRPYEISIEVSEADLRRYRLTLEQIARRIRQASSGYARRHHQDHRGRDSGAYQGTSLSRQRIRIDRGG
ncbi:MAG: hypothetical protein R2864_04640 [Syntrophotaleaceae bacterium]